MQLRYFDGFTPTFNDFFRLRDELDQLFDVGLPLSNIRSVPRGTFPAINMEEGKDDVTIHAYLPGIDPKEVDLTLEDNSLTIKGKRDVEMTDENTNDAVEEVVVPTAKYKITGIVDVMDEQGNITGQLPVDSI